MTKKSFGLVGFGAAAVLALGAQAMAGSATLFLRPGTDGGDNFNTTEFTLTNTSAPGVELTGLSWTIGDTTYNFDEIYNRDVFFEKFNPANAGTATLLTGSRDQDNSPTHVTDVFEYAFTGFTPGVAFIGQFDIDHDNGITGADAREVLFNNGDLPNSVLTLTFSDGPVVYTFPDLPRNDGTFSVVIPEPQMLGLMGLGAVGLGRRRR